MDEDTKVRLEKIEQRLTALEAKFPAASQRPLHKGISIKEYMLAKKPSGDVEKTLVIGGFLEKYQNMESFTPENLRKGFETAKKPVPENISDKISKNIRKGHMMESPGKKGTTTAYVLTSTGERYLESMGKGESKK